jgi:ParB family chromosome partitioning protein
MAKQAIESAQRMDAFRMEPEQLVIIGLDTDDGSEHPFYDERVKLPLDEAFVQNVMLNGVIMPIKVTKDPDGRVLVVAGRRRVMAAREANKRLKAEGRPLVLVPMLSPSRGEQSSMVGAMLSENEYRQDDPPLLKARKAARFMASGHSEAEACTTFGVTRVTMSAWLKLLELEPTLLKAVERNEVSASQALEQSGAGSDVQKALAEKVKGKKSNGRGRPKGKASRPGKVKVVKMYEQVKKVSRLHRETKTLAWVLGKISDDKFLE